MQGAICVHPGLKIKLKLWFKNVAKAYMDFQDMVTNFKITQKNSPERVL